MRQRVDLNAHISETRVCGNPADFEVLLEPIYHEAAATRSLVPNRLAVVRKDTGRAVAVVSNRYSLVPHTRILETIEHAIAPLDVGPVPRGIYLEAAGARMRALYKFPALAEPVLVSGEICPCIQVRNSYDGSARIGVHIGAFRFVCTNLAVGGGGAFAGGFMSVHAGEIPIEQVARQLADYLTRFERIAALYRQWAQQPVQSDVLKHISTTDLDERPEFGEALTESRPDTVFVAYNVLTDLATHRMRTARVAFSVLERINVGFQREFPYLT
jgi:hypothetical protein